MSEKVRAPKPPKHLRRAFGHRAGVTPGQRQQVTVWRHAAGRAHRQHTRGGS